VHCFVEQGAVEADLIVEEGAGTVMASPCGW